MPRAAVAARRRVSAGRPEPATFVARSLDGIGVFSASTGQIVRMLVPASEGVWLNYPYLVENGRTVLFTRSLPSCTSSIVAVPFRGGGRALYASIIEQSGGRWATEIRAIPVGATSAELGRLFMPVDAGCLAGPMARAGRSDKIAVAEYCLYVDGSSRVLAMDGNTGGRLGMIAAVPHAFVITNVDYDASGRHLLIRDDGGPVYAVRGGTLTLLVDGYFDYPTW